MRSFDEFHQTNNPPPEASYLMPHAQITFLSWCVFYQNQTDHRQTPWHCSPAVRHRLTVELTAERYHAVWRCYCTQHQTRTHPAHRLGAELPPDLSPSLIVRVPCRHVTIRTEVSRVIESPHGYSTTHSPFYPFSLMIFLLMLLYLVAYNKNLCK